MARRVKNTMPGFKDRRIVLLIVFLLVAGLFILSPWKAPNEDAPYSKVMRGPNWGIDITGGSQIILQMEGKEAKVQFSTPPDEWSQVEGFIEGVENDLKTELEWLRKENTLETGVLTVFVKEPMPENKFVSAFPDNVSLVEGSYEGINFSSGKGKELRGEMMDALEQRVDPQGTLGAQFKPIGSRYLLYEVPLENKDKARSLLGQTGKLEFFVDNKLVLWDRLIGDVGPVSYSQSMGVYLPFNLKNEGPERWKRYSEEKVDHPGVIYLDRPDESVLLFPDTLEDDLDASSLGLTDNFSFEVVELTEISFYLQVPVVLVHMDSEEPIDNESVDFLKSVKGSKARAIWLGEESDIPAEMVSGDYFDVAGVKLELESVPRKEGQGKELLYDWIADRVCGIKSYPRITEEVAGKELDELSITQLGSRSNARELQRILTTGLPVEVSIISEVTVERRLSENFITEAMIAGFAAFIAVGFLVYVFYRKIKIVIPLLFTMLSEVIITLGIVSGLSSYVSIGLAGVGGLIAVVGTGVDHQIIIADEVLREKTSEQGKLPIDRRTGRAFSVIFAAAATTVAAMAALIVFGFGAMRGFATVTLIGVGVSVLITRPAFARIIGVLLEREE